MVTVFIFAKKHYVARDGRVPVYLGISANGRNRSPINLNLRVNLDFWDESSSPPQVKKGFPGRDHINAEIAAAWGKALKIRQRYQALEKVLTYERFIKEWGGFNPYDFEQFVKDYVKRLQNARNEKTGKSIYSDSYITKVGWVMGKLTRWRQHLDLQDIDVTLIKDYQVYLASIGNTENTIYSNLRIFRRVMKDAYDQELINRNPFDKLGQLRKPKVQRDTLTIDEVKKYEELLQASLPSYLHKTLCWFLLAVYTGRRYGDLAEFDKWDIHGDYIRLIQNKTIAGIQDRKVIIIFMNDRIRSVISLIRLHQYTIPLNSVVNRFLKDLTDTAGIKDKKVTFHVARHTFNMINKSLKTDPVTRRELLGHDSFRSTQVYERPDPEQMQEAMMRWNGI